MPKYYKSGRALLNTIYNAGRIAGSGVLYDDYSEESGNSQSRPIQQGRAARFPHDGVKPSSLNGPVIIVQKAKNKGGKTT